MRNFNEPERWKQTVLSPNTLDHGAGECIVLKRSTLNCRVIKRTLEYLKSCSSRREEALANFGANKYEPPHVGSGSDEDDFVSPEPSFAERVRVMRRHLDLMVEVFGEVLGCRMFRKVAPWYARRFGPCHEFNKQVVQLVTRAQLDEILENYIRWRRQFLDDQGELQPRFQPAPMVASFMRDPAAIQRSQIPVPKGPVEVW